MVFQPVLTVAPDNRVPVRRRTSALTAGGQPATRVGAEPVTFTVTFNRDMDQSVQPQVSFGPDVPLTDYTVHPIDGGWQDARTWQGTFDITPITGDGYQLIRVAGARAADDPWLVTGDDAGRFRFEIITSGTEAMNLQASGGEGRIDLMWTQNDFDLLAGFNLYRSTSATGTFTRVNTAIIPPQTRAFTDTTVAPGQPYFYKFTVVKSDMTESNPSNLATATPLDTIAPVITHAALTSAQPGQSLTITADVTDNVRVTGVTLYYRVHGTTTFTARAMTQTTPGHYVATLDGSLLVSPGIDYYIEATDGVSIVRTTNPAFPFNVTVDDSPVVTGISPVRGPSSGGTAVVIVGSNFKAGATATIGGAACDSVVVTPPNQLACTTPPHFPAAADVVVTNPDAQSGTLLRGFTFESDTAALALPATGGGQHDFVRVPVGRVRHHRPGRGRPHDYVRPGRPRRANGVRPARSPPAGASLRTSARQARRACRSPVPAGR